MFLPDHDVPRLAAQMGNINLIYEAVGRSHFALQALQVLGANGIFVLTVPGLQAFIEADPAHIMRDMVLNNQVLLGTVNAGLTPSHPRYETLMSSGGAGRPWSGPSSTAATRQSRHRT